MYSERINAATDRPTVLFFFVKLRLVSDGKTTDTIKSWRAAPGTRPSAAAPPRIRSTAPASIKPKRQWHGTAPVYIDRVHAVVQMAPAARR